MLMEWFIRLLGLSVVLIIQVIVLIYCDCLLWREHSENKKSLLWSYIVKRKALTTAYTTYMSSHSEVMICSESQTSMNWLIDWLIDWLREFIFVMTNTEVIHITNICLWNIMNDRTLM